MKILVESKVMMNVGGIALEEIALRHCIEPGACDEIKMHYNIMHCFKKNSLWSRG